MKLKFDHVSIYCISSRIMLLDNGRVKEYNSPNNIQALNGGTNQSETDKF